MLTITGVEVTQAIQYFGSTFPVCGIKAHPVPCPDNFVPLVAGKPTAVRIYFEGATPGVPVTGFGVKLLSDGSPSTQIFPASRDSIDVPSPPKRDEPGHSVNLLIPAQASHGLWKMNVSIFEKPATGVGQAAVKRIDLTFEQRALVRIRVVRMHYKGRGLDVPPPTMADFWAMADYMQRTWPVPLPGFCVVRESVEVFDGKFSSQLDSDDPIEIGTTGTIWDILARLRSTEGFPPDVIYFGFYPDPAGSNGGAGGGWTYVAPNVIPGLSAHELGHAFGLPHAPTPQFGPTFAGTDQDFPRYGSHPWGSIGEVGFDPRTGDAFGPNHFDVMGYDLPRWISPHYYVKLLTAVGQPKPGPCSSLPVPGQLFQPPNQRQFTCHYVEGLPGGDFSKRLCGPKIDVPFGWSPTPDGPPRPIRATLLDARGEPIFEDTFELSEFSEPHDGARRRFFAITMPELDGAKRLVVTLGDKVVEDSELTLSPIRFEASAQLMEGLVRVRWTLSPEEEKGVPIFIRASSDGGRSWTAFNVPSGADQLDIYPASLPPGDDCIVEALAGERLRTTSWRSERIPVKAGREDDLLVLRGAGDKTRINYGDPVELAAVTTYGAGDEEIIWSSDRDGDLGVGGYLTIRLSPGAHVLSVRRGACGKRLQAGDLHVNDSRIPR
jgi:hypothetical protein